MSLHGFESHSLNILQQLLSFGMAIIEHNRPLVAILFCWMLVMTEESRLRCFPTAKITLFHDMAKYFMLNNVNGKILTKKVWRIRFFSLSLQWDFCVTPEEHRKNDQKLNAFGHSIK